MPWQERHVVRALALALLYVGTAKLGLAVDSVSHFATLVWAPTGIALAAVLLVGYRMLPVVSLGAFVVNRWTGAPVLVAAAIALGNTLEAAAGAALLRRTPGFRSGLTRVQDVIGLVVLAAVFSTTLSATIGTLALQYGGLLRTTFGATWRTWWLGDMIGDLIVAPVLLTLPATEWLFGEMKLGRRRLLEAAALVSLVCIGGIHIFFGKGLEHYAKALQQPVVATPLLIWAALRFGGRGIARTLFLVAVLAIWGTAVTLPPSGPTTLREVLANRQVHLAIMAGTFLVLSAVAEERRRALDQMTVARNKLAILADAGAILAPTLEFKAAASKLAQIVVARLGNACGCTVDLFEADGGMRRYASAAASADKQLLLEEEGARFSPEPSSRSPVVRASETGRPWLFPSVDESVIDALSQGHEHRALLERLGLQSLMIVPMVAREHVLGVLSVRSMRRERHYGEADLSFLSELARRSSVSLDNAMLFERAAAAIRVREDTLAMVAHDLRSPLGTIKLSADMLAHLETMDADNIARMAKTISTASDQMNHLVNELLDVAFLEAGGLAMNRAPVAAQSLLAESAAMHSARAAAKDLRIRVRADSGADVLADRDRLLQALDNLIGNAIKFTPPGGWIELAAAPEGAEVVFSVVDSGRGIAFDQFPHLFERYSKASGGKGHGLGLFIAKSIVEAHGGRIWVESRPGAGAAFRFAIPAAQRRAAQPATLEPPLGSAPVPA